MSRIPRRQYTDDFKGQAVALAEPIGPAKAARQLDVSARTLANWLAASRAGKPVSELEAELARLRAENARFKMEREIEKKRGVLCQGVQVRYAFVARERAQFPLAVLCRLLDFSHSSFHTYLGRQARPAGQLCADANGRARHQPASWRPINGEASSTTPSTKFSILAAAITCAGHRPPAVSTSTGA